MAIVQWLGPVLDALREMGGRGTPAEVGDWVARHERLYDADGNISTPGGQSRFKNEVAWARFYLTKAGLVRMSGRGWELTESGNSAHLDQESARRIFREGRLDAADEGKADEDKADEAPESESLPTPSVEGDDDAAYGFRDYPIDSLLIRSEQRTIQDVVRRIDQNRYILDPDFQREFVWKDERQSRLIESVLMRIPLPVFYLAETPEGKLVVVDGLQRLTTFHRFLHNKFALMGLNPALDNKRFADLPPKLQNRIEDAQLTIYLIDSKVPERARLDIFERVNSGVPLTRQQMRNSLYQGKATALLRALSENPKFLDATEDGLDRKSMRDREAINRFCAFYLLGFDKYRDDMDGFLADALQSMNRLSDDQIGSLRDAFLRSMTNNKTVFGTHAFRRHTKDQDRRSMINMSLFDVASVVFARYPAEIVSSHTEELRSAFFGLMQDPSFISSISLGTSDKLRVKTRFEKFMTMAVEVLGAP